MWRAAPLNVGQSHLYEIKRGRNWKQSRLLTLRRPLFAFRPRVPEERAVPLRRTVSQRCLLPAIRRGGQLTGEIATVLEFDQGGELLNTLVIAQIHLIDPVLRLCIRRGYLN
jgi:hypothetical protein